MFLVEKGKNTEEIDPNPDPGHIEDTLDQEVIVDPDPEEEEIRGIDQDLKWIYNR